MIGQSQLGRVAAAIVGGGAILVGCGGTVQFSGSTPFEVVGSMPPPEPTSERVVVTEDAIVINDKIHFDLDKATIRPESYDLLNEIVDVINKNTQIEKLSIEGHTCSLGTEQHNEKLSSDRAASVRAYLTEHGVAAERLSSLGHGESRPIASNEDEASREKNRRVEFLITAQKQLETVYDVNKQTGERTLVSQSAGGVPATPAAPAKS